jgi:hypothetical protein
MVLMELWGTGEDNEKSLKLKIHDTVLSGLLSI